MNDQPGVPEDLDEPVGVALQRLRRAASLTGEDLARLVEMSQPKISRIERGHGRIDPGDVQRIAHALGAGEELTRSLVARAEGNPGPRADWRPTAATLAGRQRGVENLEATTKVIRVFEPALVVGLLQTSEYARAVLLAFQQVAFPGDGHSDGHSDGHREGYGETAIFEAVSGRVKRQESLADPAKQFRFVMAETVLLNIVCAPEEMLGQIKRVRAEAHRDNVSVKLIPADVRWPIPPAHGFTLLDDRMVVMDLINTGLTSRGRPDAAKYRTVFDAFERIATDDIDPILDRHEMRYLDMLRRPGRADG